MKSNRGALSQIYYNRYGSIKKNVNIVGEYIIKIQIKLYGGFNKRLV